MCSSNTKGKWNRDRQKQMPTTFNLVHFIVVQQITHLAHFLYCYWKSVGNWSMKSNFIIFNKLPKLSRICLHVNYFKNIFITAIVWMIWWRKNTMVNKGLWPKKTPDFFNTTSEDIIHKMQQKKSTRAIS